MLVQRRSRLLMIAAIGMPIVVALLCAKIIRENATERRALRTVHQLGGRVGSLEFLWTKEYRITFRELQLSDADLRKLAVLKTLTEHGHWVGIMFEDTNLTRQDILDLRETLPECVIFWVEGELLDERNKPRGNDR